MFDLIGKKADLIGKKVDLIGKKVEEVFGKKEGDEEESASLSPPPFTFCHKDSGTYQYPNLYEEANEMLQVSMLIYR